MKATTVILGLVLAGLLTSARGATPDPSINFGYGVTNTGTSTQQYTFDFPMPASELNIDLPAGTYDVTATFGLTLTSGPDDTAILSLPMCAGSYMKSYINGQNAGVNIGSATESVTGGTEVFSFPSETAPFLLASTGTTMSIATTFDLTPGDSASFSGSFQVAPVQVAATPEPCAVALGLVAVGAFGVLTVRRRQSRA